MQTYFFSEAKNPVTKSRPWRAIIITSRAIIKSPFWGTKYGFWWGGNAPFVFPIMKWRKKRDGNCITFPKMVVAQGPSTIIFFFLPHLKNCHNQFEWIMFIVTKCLNAKTLKNWGVRHHCEAVRILIRWVTKHMLCVDFIKNALWADVPCITFSYEVVVHSEMGCTFTAQLDKWGSSSNTIFDAWIESFHSKRFHSRFFYLLHIHHILIKKEKTSVLVVRFSLIFFAYDVCCLDDHSLFPLLATHQNTFFFARIFIISGSVWSLFTLSFFFSCFLVCLS